MNGAVGPLSFQLSRNLAKCYCACVTFCNMAALREGSVVDGRHKIEKARTLLRKGLDTLICLLHCCGGSSCWECAGVVDRGLFCELSVFLPVSQRKPFIDE